MKIYKGEYIKKVVKKNMIKKIVLLLLLLAAIPGVLAIDTSININTWNNYDVDVLILEPTDSYSLIYTYSSKSDGNGMLAFIYKNDIDEFKVSVKVKKNGEVEMYENFGIYKAGEPVYLRVIPGNVSGNYIEEMKKALEEQTAQEQAGGNTTEVTIETQTENPAITGKAVAGRGGVKLPAWAYYTLAAAVIVVAIAFFVTRNLYMKMPPRPPNPKTFTPKAITPSSPSSPSYDNELMDAENKIRQAQEEIDKIKNRKQQLMEAESKFEQAKAELEKAKQGYNIERNKPASNVGKPTYGSDKNRPANNPDRGKPTTLK